MKKYAVFDKYLKQQKSTSKAYPPVPKYDSLKKKYNLLHIMFWIIGILLIGFIIYFISKYFIKKKNKKEKDDDEQSVESIESDNCTNITDNDLTVRPLINDVSDIKSSDTNSNNSSILNDITIKLPKMTDFDKTKSYRKRRRNKYKHKKNSEPKGLDMNDFPYASLN